MQYIPNIVFWLQNALESAVVTMSFAGVIFILCLLGIGIGIGRLWNKKWKGGIFGTCVSIIIGLLASVLSMVYMGMGHMKDTVLAPSVRVAVQDELTNSLVNNTKLLEAAFKAGLKNIISSGMDSESLSEEATEFVIPGQTEEAKRINKEQFIAGVTKVLAQGQPEKKVAKAKSVKVESLGDMPPFVHGYEPVNRDVDGALYSTFEENMQGRDGQPISIEDPFWYNCLAQAVVDKSLKGLNNSICKGIDSQRSSAITVMIILMFVQVGIISYLAYSDIRPRLNK